MSAYRPAAEKTSATSRTLRRRRCRHHPCLLLCDDVVESDEIPEVQTRIDLLRKGGYAGRKQRRVPRDAHGDHDGIDLRHGGAR